MYHALFILGVDYNAVGIKSLFGGSQHIFLFLFFFQKITCTSTKKTKNKKTKNTKNKKMQKKTNKKKQKTKPKNINHKKT